MSRPSPVCRCCGSDQVTLRGTKRGEFIRREFEFHQCAACGFLMVEPFSGFAIYDDAYYRGAGPDPYVDYAAEYADWRTHDRRLEFDDLARIASNHLETLASDNSQLGSTPRAIRWLDFGCGAGGFLKYLRERTTLAGRPLELTGHDVGSYADLLATRDRFRILDLAALQREPTARFDVISMVEVIEHLPDPLAPLQLVARLLKPGGLLLLTTGNLASPVARRRGIRYRYCAPEIHVSLFNPVALARLYARAGLAPYPVSYHGAVRFKVLKTVRHRPAARALASALLAFPRAVRLVDRLYGVSAMPCATKPVVADGSPVPQSL